MERFDPLLTLAPLGCLLVEAGVIRRVNAQAVETMDIPADRMVGVALKELLVPDHEQACTELLEQSISEPSDRPRTRSVRLARGLLPLELMARALAGDLVLIGVRSMEAEHRYSAQAGGALTHDTITGFPDHYHVLSQLNERLRVPNRKPLALLALWIDDLPELSRTHGMRVVNRVMRETGLRLQDRLRGPDLLGRFDDAGFLVIMSTDSTSEQLTEVADRLRSEVAFPVELDRGLVSFTASVVVGSITSPSVSIERVLALLEASANRVASSKGNRTDFLSI